MDPNGHYRSYDRRCCYLAITVAWGCQHCPSSPSHLEQHIQHCREYRGCQWTSHPRYPFWYLVGEGRSQSSECDSEGLRANRKLLLYYKYPRNWRDAFCSLLWNLFHFSVTSPWSPPTRQASLAVLPRLPQPVVRKSARRWRMHLKSTTNKSLFGCHTGQATGSYLHRALNCKVRCKICSVIVYCNSREMKLGSCTW